MAHQVRLLRKVPHSMADLVLYRDCYKGRRVVISTVESEGSTWRLSDPLSLMSDSHSVCSCKKDRYAAIDTCARPWRSRSIIKAN